MSRNYGILVVDDEAANLQKLKRTFLDDYKVLEATSGEAALDILRDHDVAVIITDQRMPGLSGVELLRRSLQISSDTVRIILTGYTAVDDLMDAINRGHVDRYITKPWEPLSLKETVRRELQRWELERENRELAEKLEAANRRLSRENLKLKTEVEFLKENEHQLVYRSQAMKDLVGLLDQVVATDSTVLIQGETGTGKELLARYIHNRSRRAGGPFVPVNCGAIPGELVESSFFGHLRGSFTGATEDRKGFFEMADGGTLFLDEIGETPFELQVKFLRALQEREIVPVGAQHGRPIDVRFVASTNRNLSNMVEAGEFRQDLFFRLNVFSVHVPPLRARKEDIALLTDFFLDRICTRLAKWIRGVDAELIDKLTAFDWPGNVRELENEVERMVILAPAEQPLSESLLSERIRRGAAKPSERDGLKEQLAELERRLILQALERHNNNRTHAAEALGITRQTIISKLKQYHDSKT